MMSFYDKVPCLGLDGFIADIQAVNKSIHFEDLKLAVDSVFDIGENSKDKQHVQNIKHQNHSLNRKPKNSTSLSFRCFTIICIATGCLFSLPIICSETISFIDWALNDHLDVSLFPSLLDDFVVVWSVVFRKITLYIKFQETFSVTDLDFGECILDNPLHKLMLQTAMNCEYCTELDQPSYITADSTSVTSVSLSIFQPIIYEQQGTELDLEQLQQLLMKNTHMVNSDTVSVSSNCPYVKTVEDFMNEKIAEQLHQDSGIHIQWRSLSYLSAHILRPVVPQPHQFFKNVLRSYRSMIHLDSHLSPPFSLHPSQSHNGRGFLMYAQLSGFRRLVFSPVQDCASTCSSFTVVMKPKDVVTFNRDFWTVNSEASEDDTSLSLSFTDEFELVLL